MRETKKDLSAAGWREAANKDEWESFLAGGQSFGANFTQSYNWGLFQRRLGQPVAWRLFFRQGRPVAGYIAAVQKGRFYSFAAVVGGPAIDWSDGGLLVSFRDDLASFGRRHGCHFAMLCPHVLDSAGRRRAAAAAGFRKAPAGISVEFAGVLDLNLSDEELRAKMSQGMRRKIRKARKDEKIEIGVSDNRREAAAFARLHREHSKIQGYVAFSEKRLVCQFETYAADGQALIYSARRDGEVLAMNMIFFYGREASYHYGVSSLLGQKHSSAPLLHLEAIAEARQRGLRFYNFWGITRADQTRHRYYGVSQFKRGFGVLEHRYLPPQNLVLKPLAYPFIWLLIRLRRIWRRL